MRVAFALLALLAFPGMGYSQQFEWRQLLESGQTISGAGHSGTIQAIDALHFSGGSSAAVAVRYYGGTCPQGRVCAGLVRIINGNASLIIGESQTVPGETFLLTGHAQDISINRNGSVAFLAGHYRGHCAAGNTCSTIIAYSNGVLKSLAAQADIAPGTSDGLFKMVGLGSTSINDAGQIAFAGKYRQGSCTYNECDGIFLFTNGKVSPIALMGSPFRKLLYAPFYSIRSPSLNDEPRVAITAAFSDKRCGSLCFGMIVLGKEERVVAGEGWEAPRTGGGHYVGGKGSFGFGPPRMNDSGTVAFSAEYSGGLCSTDKCTGVFVSTADEFSPRVTLLAATGQSLPAGQRGSIDQISRNLAFNADGQVAFLATAAGGICSKATSLSAAYCNVVLTAGPNGSDVAAAIGQVIPGFRDETIARIYEPSINDANEIGLTVITKSGTFRAFVLKPKQ